MVKWKLVYTKQTQKDAKKIASVGLKEKTVKLLNLLAEYHFAVPPRFEKLTGDLSDAYSRRINIRHRLIYQVYEKEKVVKIIRMWTHYE